MLRAQIVGRKGHADLLGSSRERLRGAPLAKMITEVVADDRDEFVDEMLGYDYIPDDDALPRGAVPYLPCPVDEIVAVHALVPVTENDTFVDLGCGVGRVAITTALLTGARAIGIEIQPRLAEVARDRVTALGLDRVRIIAASALDVPLEGNVFFMYAPFNGDMLRAMLARLQAHARTRPIVIATCDLELHVPWLVERKQDNLALSIYDARV